MATFTLLDPTPGAQAPPGPWGARPAPAPSFSTEAGPEANAPIWSAQLSGDLAAARAELDAADLTLRRQEQALDLATERMGRAARGGASFAAGLPAPERELLLVLEDMRQPRGASFSTSAAALHLEQAQAQFRAFAAQVRATLGNYAVVETRVAAALVARSSVSWTGSMRSLLLAGISADQHELHRRTLALALRSRAALLRTFATVTRGAAIVATAISSPAGPLLALPAAWRFVSQLLEDLRGTEAA